MRTAAFLAALLGAVLCGPAAAKPKPAFGAPAAWVQVANVPAPPPGDDAPAVQTLLDDNQSRLGPDGDAYFNRRIWKIRKKEGLSRFTSLAKSWDPDSESMTFHWIRLIRDGKTIDLLKDGRKMLVLRRERDLELAMLDGRVTASQQLEGLQEGDILDYAWTHTRREPIAPDRSYDSEGLGFQGVASRYRAIVSWPEGAPVQWKATPGFPKPSESRRDGRVWLTVDLHDAEAPRAPVGAPARFRRVAELETSGFASWREISQLMAPHFAKAAQLKAGSPLKAEAAVIAARTSDPKARAFAALQLVEDKTRYFFIGINGGGYVPAPADLTWTRKFGDCKGKTVLLLALLKELGIEAEPALVNLGGGDGIDERPPSLGAFNHVIVRAAIDGKTYWLDGTRTGDQGGLDSLKTPPHHWALPLRAGGADLERLVIPALTKPTMEAFARIDASKGLDARAAIEVRMRVYGDTARAMRQMLASASKSEMERSFRQSMSGGVSNMQVDKIDWKDDAEHDAIEMQIAGSEELTWVKNPDVGRREYRIAVGASGGGFPKREPGPNHDAPFVVPYPTYVHTVNEIVLPEQGKGYVVRGPNLSQVVGGMEIRRVSTLKDGVARFEIDARSVTPEISADEAEAANKAFRSLIGEDTLVRAPS